MSNCKTDISDFRVLNVWCGDGFTPTTYIIHKDEVDRMWEAVIKLHHEPGVNPHNGNKTSELRSMQLRQIAPRGPFWWTTPDLMNNNDPAGARLWEEGPMLRDWQDWREGDKETPDGRT